MTVPPVPLRPPLLASLGVFLAGLLVGVVLHWPALTHFGIYKEDILQSPHWAAAHGETFRPDDPFVAYARFNESPLQNGIYWIGTWFVEYVTLSKLLAVVSYGLLSLVFFVVGWKLHGPRFAGLLFLFITFLPDQWEFSAGFFSKYWAIPLLLLTLYLLQRENFRGLVLLVPFAALAYPTAGALIGTTVAVAWILDCALDRARARRLFGWAALAGTLAFGVLALKYLEPSELTGPMRPGAELQAMPEIRAGGYPSHYVPIPPVYRDLLERIDDPFLWANALLFLFVLGFRRLAWERSWSALLLASVLGYVLAELLFMRLYIPNRYTRYSLPLLLALWNARNWDLLLERIGSRRLRVALVALLVVIGGGVYRQAWTEGRGFTDKREMTPVSRFIASELPPRILVGGSPQRLDDVMIQAKRSVLVPYKLSHPWFVDYYEMIRERTRATLDAHFAAGPGPVNALHARYGVTHFLVERALFDKLRRGKRFFARPYSDEVYRKLGGRREFWLESPPRKSVIWEDENYMLLELPVPTD